MVRDKPEQFSCQKRFLWTHNSSLVAGWFLERLSCGVTCRDGNLHGSDISHAKLSLHEVKSLLQLLTFKPGESQNIALPTSFAAEKNCLSESFLPFPISSTSFFPFFFKHKMTSAMKWVNFTLKRPGFDSDRSLDSMLG